MYKKIALLKLCCPGDLLFTTPAIRAIKNCFPNAELSYLTGRYSSFIPEHNPHIANTIIIEPPFKSGAGGRIGMMLSNIRALRKHNFDLVVSFHRSRLVAVMVKAGGARQIVGFASARPLANITVAFDPGKLEIIRNLDLARVLGAEAKSYEMEYHTTREDDQKADELLRNYGLTGDFAVIAPGGGENPGTTMHIKRWPSINFMKVASYLRKRYNIPVVAVGSASERNLADSISPDINMAGKVNFPLLAAVLKRARIMIGNDSAPLYLASAVGIKTVGLYGPTSPKHFGSLSPNHRAVVNEVWCHPCHTPARIRRGHIGCPTGAWACMLALRPETVNDEIDDLLTQDASGKL